MATTLRKLQAAAEQQAKLEDSLTASFARELTQVVKLLNRQIRRLVQQFQVERGRIVSTQANLGRALATRRDVLTALNNAGFRRLAQVAVDAPLDALTTHILRTNRIAGLAAKLTPVDIDAIAALKSLRLAELMGVEDEAATALWRTVLDGVLGARPTVDLVDDLEDALDVSARQARVLYDTAVSTFGRHVDQLQSEGKADEIFVYVGPLDSKTRKFCQDHVGKVYTRSAIDKLNNGIRGYGNVMLNGGGPNCRHMMKRVSALDTETLALVNTGKRVPDIQDRLDSLKAA